MLTISKEDYLKAIAEAEAGASPSPRYTRSFALGDGSLKELLNQSIAPLPGDDLGRRSGGAAAPGAIVMPRWLCARMSQE